MTVSELIQKLQALGPEWQDAAVLDASANDITEAVPDEDDDGKFVSVY